MNEIINKLISDVGIQKGGIVSVGSAAVGSSLTTVSETVSTTLADPTWFEILAPFLQTGAWGVAILAGIITIKNGLKNREKK